MGVYLYVCILCLLCHLNCSLTNVVTLKIKIFCQLGDLLNTIVNITPIMLVHIKPCKVDPGPVIVAFENFTWLYKRGKFKAVPTYTSSPLS